ncbi:hypothetical protein ACT1U9_19520 [Streptomyces sp. BR1]|uniref:hypothetical protein n=1 Tax=Streptomyces sp. BR1 TaxID=1592323 RepID=UPI00402BA7F3
MIVVVAPIALMFTSGCGASAPDIPKAACWGVFGPEDLRALVDKGSDVTYRQNQSVRIVYPNARAATCTVAAKDGPLVGVTVERSRDKWGESSGKWEGAGLDAAKVGKPAVVTRTEANQYVTCDRSAFRRPATAWDPNAEQTLHLRIEAHRAPDAEASRTALKSMVDDLARYVHGELECGRK